MIRSHFLIARRDSGRANSIACIFLEKRLTRTEHVAGASAAISSCRDHTREFLRRGALSAVWSSLCVRLVSWPKLGLILPTPETLSTEVDNILATRCVSCHGPEQKKGGLDLSRRGTAFKGGDSGVVIVPGSPEESPLVDKVIDGEMPPTGKLARSQIASVRAWVEAGATYLQRTHYSSPRRCGLVVVAANPPGVATCITPNRLQRRFELYARFHAREVEQERPSMRLLWLN